MIGVEEAKKLVENHSQLLAETELSLVDCGGHYLSTDVLAAIDLPPFRQSAMDGYAVNFNNSREFNCIGEIPAGSSDTFDLKANEAVRIFTGAAVPESANLIIMQEWIEKHASSYPDVIHLLPDREIKLGDHIRPMGEQIVKGELAMNKGDELNPAAISYLQSFGYQSLKVYNKAKVCIVITGDELIEAGRELKYGQIYESNGLAIRRSVEESGFEVVSIVKCSDNLEQTIKSISMAIESSDVCIISGGISVGEYDYVHQALTQNQLKSIFYKVKQKPGKPLFFGTKENKSVFALPGNPAAALTCMYEYVIPHLKLRSGAKNAWPISIQLALSESFTKKGDRAMFLKAFAMGSEVKISTHQASSMLSSFTQANCLVYIPTDQDFIAKGTLVEVHLL